MKKEFAEFLFKRLKTKVDDLRGAESSYDIDTHLDDVDVYIETLKDIVVEVLKP